MSTLQVYHVLTSSCSEDHGGCLGKCSGEIIHPRFREIPVRLPRNVGDLLIGMHFHIAYDAKTNRWYARDYDCLINVASVSAEDAVQRLAVQVYCQKQRMRVRIEHTPV